MRHRWYVAVLFVASLASPAAAQTGPTQPTEALPGRFEVAGSFAGLFIPIGNSLVGGEARIYVTPRLAIELLSHVDVDRLGRGSTYGLYSIQLHQLFRSHGRLSAFATYGATGFFDWKRTGEQRITYSTGDTLVYPARTYRSATAPLLPTAGGGVRVRFTSRLALETGIRAYIGPEGVPLAATAALGVSIGRRPS